MSEFKDLLRAIGVRGSDIVSLGTMYVDENGERKYHNRAHRAAKAVEVVEDWEDRDGWFSVGLLSSEGTKRRRVADVVGVRSLYTDLDIKPDGLASMDEARAVVRRLSRVLGCDVAAAVLTGGGVQPYWRLERGPLTDWEPGEAGEATRRKVAALYRRWGRLVRNVVEVETGGKGKVDSVWDLARILRVPGTTNTKYADGKGDGSDGSSGRKVQLRKTGKTTGSDTVSLERLEEILAELGIDELAGDGELAGPVVSPVDEWGWAVGECVYVRAMIEGWKDAEPAGRHPWLMGQATRLAAARRLGYLSEELWDEGRRVLWDRFTELLDRPGDARGAESGDAEAFDWGMRTAAGMDVERAITELGGRDGKPHRHDGDTDDPFTRGCPAAGGGGSGGNDDEDDGAAVEREKVGMGAGFVENDVRDVFTLRDYEHDKNEREDGDVDAVRSPDGEQVEPGKPASPPATVIDRRVADQKEDWGGGRYTDRWFAEAFSYQVAREKFCWSSSDGWLAWDSRRWKRCPDERVVETAGRWGREKLAGLLRKGITPGSADYDAWKTALSKKRMNDIAILARGICEVDATVFDANPDLLNCLNGVVDLKDGRIYEHAPGYYMMKLAGAAYVPGAEHADWKAALEAIPESVRSWLRVRYGQGVTGHPVPDDVMVVQYGSGSNGKSSVMAGVSGAVGDYHRLVSERVLIANPGDHPTELMDLRGCRLAIVEETPEARRLNVQRLKKVLGVPEITARHIRKDSVTFDATHSLFLSTNYKPVVEETDHGTWRRLALVRFPYLFRKSSDHQAYAVLNDGEVPPDWRVGDPGLRDRLTLGDGGRAEAVLAWLVEGARMWYAAGRAMPVVPEQVALDTRSWRTDSDVILAYCDDRIEFEPGYHMMGTDLLLDFNSWLESHGHKPWGARLLAERLGGHEEVVAHHVEQARFYQGDGQLSRPEDDSIWTHLPTVPGRYNGWWGMRFVKPEKDLEKGVEKQDQSRADEQIGHIDSDSPSEEENPF